MKKILILLLPLIFVSGCIGQEQPATGEIKFFTCPDDCPETIENLLEQAENRVYCELYYLTYDGYINKMKGLAMLKKNVTVRLILDYNNLNEDTRTEFIGLDNVEIRLMRKYNYFHPKVCLIDDVIFIGSHNWSQNSVERNREVNVLIFNSERVIDQYLEIFEEDWKDALS